MKAFKPFVFLVVLLISSCNYINKKQEVKEEISNVIIQIPNIQNNKSSENFTLKNGVLLFNGIPYSGIMNEYYSNGNPKSKSDYYQGKREGKYFGYYPNKKKWFERYYAKGIKIRTHIGWFQSGQLMFEYQFYNGVYDGYTKDWHSNGQMAKHFNFLKGKEAGIQKMWQPSGEIRANFFTVNGDRHGLIGLKNCVSVVKTENE